MIVSEIPGTTRDSIDTVLERGDRTFVLVDTAGLRRKRRHRQGIEYYSELRALEAAERADVALVLIDASQGVVDQDLAVADVARKADCSTLVVLSKWDVSDGDASRTCEAHLRRRLRQRPRVHRRLGEDRPRARAPARHGRRALRPARRAHPDARAQHARSRSCASGASRRRATASGSICSTARRSQTRPPRFRIFVNDPGLVTRDYGFWVENELRERFGLEGVPVSIDFVRRRT